MVGGMIAFISDSYGSVSADLDEHHVARTCDLTRVTVACKLSDLPHDVEASRRIVAGIPCGEVRQHKVARTGNVGESPRHLWRRVPMAPCLLLHLRGGCALIPIFQGACIRALVHDQRGAL